MKGLSLVKRLKSYISEYYKNIFGPPPINYCVLNEPVTHDIKQLFEVENNILVATLLTYYIMENTKQRSLLPPIESEGVVCKKINLKFILFCA
jgi:hypothetical protein